MTMLQNQEPRSGSSYEEVYEESLNTLSNNLQHFGTAQNKAQNTKTRMVSLGRKGVKLSEYLAHIKKKELNGSGVEPPVFPVVSEHALPFISKRDRDKKMTYALMDDALYYGSSAKKVAQDVYVFENIYNIERKEDDERIGFFSAIDTEEPRPNFDRYIDPIISTSVKRRVGQGYSHFFAKRLASDIRTLENTFEIEFPVITYKLDKRIAEKKERDKWKDEVEAAYKGTAAQVYVVEHEENYSLNILLDNTYGCCFNKVRLFPNNFQKEDNYPENRIKVTCMSPYPIPDDDYLLEHLFDNAPEGYKALWKEIFDRCRIPTSDTNPSNIMDYYTIARFRCNKSLVIMANYLLSFSTFIQQSRRLEKAFREAGLTAEFKGIEAGKELYYLLGDTDFCREVADKLGRFYADGTECSGVYVSDSPLVDYTVFENSKKVDDSIATLIRLQDDYMLGKSQNMEEALGALFFNQDVFYEKQVLAGNPISQDFNRLRIGYTFEMVRKKIRDAVKRGLLKLGKNEEFEFDKTIHRWMDQRIDEASIVPQYLLDEKSGYWVRAFRHGENEEPLLAHLARFVVFVYLAWDEKSKLGWIEKNRLQHLLAEAYNVEGIDNIDNKNRKEQIVECTNINIFTDANGELVFINNHYDSDEEAGQPHNVLQYMLDMCILAEEETDKITIHKRANYFLQPGITTMSTDYEDKIREKMEQIYHEMAKPRL